jgi:glycosyltransferase involved in cell wall biosynthesis
MHPLVLLAHRRAAIADCRLALKFTNPIQRSAAGWVRNAMRDGFYRYAADQAALILTLSETSRLEAAALAPEASAKIRIVDNPYVEERLLTRKRRPAKVDPPLLLSVGRLIEQKDPLMLIEATAGLADRPWRLAMLGEGPLRAACEARAKALGIANRIEFAGFVADPSPWFDKARLFLLSSRYEELPAVLFEAMVARCSIVSTASSAAVVNLLDQGRLGRIVPPADTAAFRAAVAHALDDLSPARIPGAWIKRFTIGNGVASHAEALGLR